MSLGGDRRRTRTAATAAETRSADSEPSATTQPRPDSATAAAPERELGQHDEERTNPVTISAGAIIGTMVEIV